MDGETRDNSSKSFGRFSTEPDLPTTKRMTTIRASDLEQLGFSGDNPRKSYRKLNEVFNSLPVHFTGRIRDVDNLLAKGVVEAHAGLVLSLHEISVVDPSLLQYLEESEEWDTLLSNIRKTVIQYRKEVKKHIQSLASLVELPEKSKFNVNAFINLDANVISKVTGVTDFPVDIKKSLGDVVAILGTEAESRIDHVTPDKQIKVMLSNIEADTDYLQNWFLKKTEKVKQDINKCWSLLRREGETKPGEVLVNQDSSLIVKQLKAAYTFYHNAKLTKNILTLESTLHRVGFTKDGSFVFAGGHGCKITRRDMKIASNNIFSEKSKVWIIAEYNVFGMTIDTEDRCWIHDGHTNQIIGFDAKLQEKCLFNGVCFNRRIG